MLSIRRWTDSPVILKELKQHRDGEILVGCVLQRYTEQFTRLGEIGLQLVGKLRELRFYSNIDGELVDGVILATSDKIGLNTTAAAILGQLEHHVLTGSLIVDESVVGVIGISNNGVGCYLSYEELGTAALEVTYDILGNIAERSHQTLLLESDTIAGNGLLGRLVC